LCLHTQLFDAGQFAVCVHHVQQGAGSYLELVFVVHHYLFQRFCLRFADFNARLVFTHLQGGNFGALDEAVVNLIQFGLCCGGLVFLQFDAGRGRLVEDVGAHSEVHGGIVGVCLRFESDDRVTRALCHFQRRLDAFQFTRLGAVAGVRPRVFFADAVFVVKTDIA